MDKALELGVTISEFWDMTPRETYLLILCRIKHEQRSQKTIAWLMAGLMRSKQLPSLESWLKPSMQVSHEDMERMANEHRRLQGALNAG